MIGNELRHLEHRYLALAAEYRAELVISVNQPPVDSILQLVLLDVVQIFFVTSVRGNGDVPTTAPSVAEGVIAFIKAALGLRLAPDFLGAAFLAVAMVLLPVS